MSSFDFGTCDSRADVMNLASMKAMEITQQIRQSIGALKTLEAMIQFEPGFVEGNFHQIAPALRRTYKGIACLALAKYGVISTVDPPDPNSALVGFPLLHLLQQEARDSILSGEAKASTAWDADASTLVVLHPIFAPSAARVLPSDEWTYNGRNYSRDCSLAAPMDELHPCAFPGVVHPSGNLAHFWGFAMLLANFEDVADLEGLKELEHRAGGWVAAGFTHFAWRLSDAENPARMLECTLMTQISMGSAAAYALVGVDAAVPEIGLRWRFDLVPAVGWQASSDWWVTALVAIPVTLIFGVGMGISVIASLRKRTLDKLNVQNFRFDVLSKAVSASVEALEKFQFPLCLVSVDDFLKCGAYPSYEELRNLGKHVWLDSCWDAMGGDYEDSGILLLSYEGMSEGTDHQDSESAFDKDGDVYKAMVTSIRGLKKYGLKFNWVWSQYSCMPQQNSIQHQCATNSIAGYCSCFTAMLVVESRKGAEQHTFSSSFASWSRLERLCFVTCQCLGTDSMKVFRYTEQGVLKKERVDRSAVEFAWDILRGSFQCCTTYHADGRPCDKQRFVGAILSTYWRLLAVERAGGGDMASQLVKVLRDSNERYFPPTFTYWSETHPLQLELFAGLLHVAHQMFAEDSAKVDAERMIAPGTGLRP
ncbi:unnamed protein product [Symbiodinium natans]|uniref:CHASE domain-containing protein n=1 Tax=Symbiodinium natans TaxID=878477 RepID=A0A812MXJ1_9DINO|nr:unnamed protein product [Symbiodinium natans]